MATKKQIVKYLEARKTQALELSKIFKTSEKPIMEAQYYGEFELANRVLMMIDGALDIEEFTNG